MKVFSLFEFQISREKMNWSSLVRFPKLVHSPVTGRSETGSLRKRCREERNYRLLLYMKVLFGVSKRVTKF